MAATPAPALAIAFWRDALAVAGGVLGAGYVTAGGRLRQDVSTTAYTSVCYGVATALLLVTCLAAGARLGGYPARTWLKLVAVTAGPQLVGHSLINRVL